jgi:hypothetical protein
MVVELDACTSSWRATFAPRSRPSTCPWDAVEGKWAVENGLVLTAAVVL